MLGFVISVVVSTGVGVVITAATVATTVATTVAMVTARLGYDYIRGLREGLRPQQEEVQQLSAEHHVLIEKTESDAFHNLKK